MSAAVPLPPPPPPRGRRLAGRRAAATGPRRRATPLAPPPACVRSAPALNSAGNYRSVAAAMSPRLRVFLCILSLLVCIAITKGLDIPSGRDTAASEPARKVSGWATNQGADPPGGQWRHRDALERRSGHRGPHKAATAASTWELAHPDQQHGPKEAARLGNGRDRDAPAEPKSEAPHKATGWGPVLGKAPKSPAPGIGETDTDALKALGLALDLETDEVEDEEEAVEVELEEEEEAVEVEEEEEEEEEGDLPASLDPSASDSSSGFFDETDYYAYDYLGDGAASTERSKKEAPAGGRRPPARLAELLAAGGHPQLALLNLSTPNPDLEITIEVVVPGGERGRGEGRGQGVVVSMDLRDEAAVAGGKGPAPGPAEDKTAPGRPSATADDDDDDTAEDEATDDEDDGEEEDSVSSFEFIPMHPFRDPNLFEYETGDSEEVAGTWSGWSECSASCGGGRSERSRSCGFSCTATESKDCNHQACPSRVEDDDVRIETTSSEMALQHTDYLEQVLDPQNFVTESCEEWMGCRSETLLAYLSRLQDLPDCPCFYPTDIRRNSAIWDRQKRRLFRWREASGRAARLDVYKPTASRCITSLLSSQSTSLAAQQCCYDGSQRLITRGPGAGTPQLISAEVSPELHHRIDVMPWVLCKGDWTRYNKVRHPNNMRECRETPDQAEFYHLYQEAKNF